MKEQGRGHGGQQLLRLIAQGEHEQQDFKHQVSDARKIARSIAAFANHRGGRLLVGVKDNGNIAGIRTDEEIYMVEQAAQMYCRPEQPLTFEVYRIDGKSVLRVNIAEAQVKPVEAPDENGRWRVYYRVADENILASAVHIEVMRHSAMGEAADEERPTLSFTAAEQSLLEYLRTHGGITLTGYTRLAHISRAAAQESVVALCDMGVVRLEYHDGTCTIIEC